MSDYGSEPDEVDDELIDVDIQEEKEIEVDESEKKEYDKFKKSYVELPKGVKKKGAPKKTITKADVKELQRFCKGKFIQNCSDGRLVPLDTDTNTFQ